MICIANHWWTPAKTRERYKNEWMFCFSELKRIMLCAYSWVRWAFRIFWLSISPCIPLIRSRAMTALSRFPYNVWLDNTVLLYIGCGIRIMFPTIEEHLQHCLYLRTCATCFWVEAIQECSRYVFAHTYTTTSRYYSTLEWAKVLTSRLKISKYKQYFYIAMYLTILVRGSQRNRQ